MFSSDADVGRDMHAGRAPTNTTHYIVVQRACHVRSSFPCRRLWVPQPVPPG